MQGRGHVSTRYKMAEAMMRARAEPEMRFSPCRYIKSTIMSDAGIC